MGEGDGHRPSHSPANAFAFDGAHKGWERVGESLREVLAGAV